MVTQVCGEQHTFYLELVIGPCCYVRSHCQHRARRAAENRLCNRPHQEVLQSFPSVRSHHYQVNAMFRDPVGNGLLYCPAGKEWSAGYSGFLGQGDELLTAVVFHSLKNVSPGCLRQYDWITSMGGIELCAEMPRQTGRIRHGGAGSLGKVSKKKNIFECDLVYNLQGLHNASL